MQESFWGTAGSWVLPISCRAGGAEAEMGRGNETKGRQSIPGFVETSTSTQTLTESPPNDGGTAAAQSECGRKAAFGCHMVQEDRLFNLQIDLSRDT